MLQNLVPCTEWKSGAARTIQQSAVNIAACRNELILDTVDLIKQLQHVNESKTLENENVYLFALDVKALYPSIKPELALQAIRDVLQTDKSTDKNTRTAIARLTELSIENSYVSYRNECFKP